MLTVYKHEHGSTRCLSGEDHIDPAWLRPDSGVWIWVDLEQPTADEARVLAELFRFHELAIEDALGEVHHPKIESYGEYLYLILHGIDFQAKEHCFATRDVDFFLGPNYLVTVHAGVSRSVARVRDLCMRNGRVLGEGAGDLLYRIVDTMVDNYRPEVDELSDRLDALEEAVFEDPRHGLVRDILAFKRDIASLRQVVLPQRDAVARLARREYPLVGEQLAYRFRDVHDHLVRLSDESMFFQDRITSILDAHLSAISNQLNSVMKVLTIIATLFMPLTFVTGLYGMNVPLPHFPWGGERAQFWYVVGIMLSMSGGMLAWFRHRRWI